MSAKSAATQRIGLCERLPADPSPSGTGIDPRVPDRVAEQVRELLKLPRQDGVDSERLLELVPHLLRLALVMDTVAWGAWKQRFSPAASGTIRPGAPLQRVLREHLCGAGGQPSAEIDRLRELARAIISGVAQCGGEVASRVMRSFSPADIEADAGGGGLRGRDAECWRAYKSRAERLDAGTIEREVTGVLARFVEKWMRHTDAGSRAS